jgi:hypothetical protein
MRISVERDNNVYRFVFKHFEVAHWFSFEEHAQNGVRRESVPDSIGGARRTLCAFEKHAQNGVRREPVPDTLGGARRTLCAFGEYA